MAKMASLHLAISEMTVYISRNLASSDFSTQLNQEYTSQQILTCVPTNHVDREMGQNMDHDVWIHHRRLAALVDPAAYKRNQNDQRGWYPAQRGNNSYNGRTKRRCFACGMVGHMVKDCWKSA